jgi:hypothetical protein
MSRAEKLLQLGREAERKKGHKPSQKTLISFESGHYKEFTGQWLGDSVWGHFKKNSGSTVHINKDKVEYIETWPLED